MPGTDETIPAVMPPESEAQLREAREKARAQARPGDWLWTIIEHHEAIERAFATVSSASDVAARRAAEKRLAVLLTGHAIAEEAAVYPVLARVCEQRHADAAYAEQASVKMQLAALETLEPMSQDYLDRLGRLAVEARLHSYKEERQRLPELLSRASPEMNQRIGARYREEFERYTAETAPRSGAAPGESRSFAVDQRVSPG